MPRNIKYTPGQKKRSKNWHGEASQPSRNRNDLVNIIGDNKRRAQEIVSPDFVASSQNSVKRLPFKRAVMKKHKDFTPEERAKILARVKKIGVTEAAREAGTTKGVIMNWLENMERTMESVPQESLPETRTLTQLAQAETQNTSISSEAKNTTTEEGNQNMNAKTQNAENTQLKKSEDFTPEEKARILARAQKIGTIKAAEEAGTTMWVVRAWSRKTVRATLPILPDSETAEKITAPENKPVKRRRRRSAPVVVPGNDGLPPKKEKTIDYTPEDKAIIVAKADEVGSSIVTKAFGLHSYTLRDWRRTVARITAKQSVSPVQAAAPKATPPASPAKPQKHEPAPVSAPVTANVERPAISQTVPQKTENSSLPLELEVVLLREKVSSLTQQVEKLRSAVTEVAKLV